MIDLKTREEVEKIRKSGRILCAAFDIVRSNIKTGIPIIELDRLFEEFVIKNGAVPGCKGYEEYPNALCISVNDEIVHGIPSVRKIMNGDVVSFDSCVLLDGWHSDSAFTVIVGQSESEMDTRLVEVTEKALFIGIEQARVGNRIGDISFSIQNYVEMNGFSVVREYSGHGIGRKLHEDPVVPNFGRKNTGPLIKEGMCIAIEPMVCEGKSGLYIEKDGWTAKTIDGLKAAHFEHTVYVSGNGSEILTI
jgi:methionyl aminopeptidase